MTNIHIRPVSLEEVVPIRMNELDPPRSRDHSITPGDLAEESVHLAAILNNNIVGVGSIVPERMPLLPNHAAVRLRGLAVLRGYRGRGIGRMLLSAQVASAENATCSIAWFYSRLRLSSFYSQGGFVRTEHSIHHFLTREIVHLFVNEPTMPLMDNDLRHPL